MTREIYSMLVFSYLWWNAPLAVAQPPLVEKYLHSGQLARGEQVLEAALAEDAGNGQLRFGLAVLQLVRGVERLGQLLHEYACLPDNDALFIRIPVPHNPDPSEITYPAFRRMLEGFRSDLATVESTLAGIKADEVSLPLRLADIRLDLTGKGEASERFIEILNKLLGPNFRLQADNPEFLVCFDRGDVAWLRAYCHLLMGTIDLNLAFDTESEFDLRADQRFAKPKYRFAGTPGERREKWGATEQLKVTEPARLGHFRRHMLKVCELNRETWSFIRAERDNDHEWLPNPKQTGVLRMPVTDRMIDAWLSMVTEVEGLFDGRKAVPALLMELLSPTTNKRMNLKRFLDDPPDEIDIARIRRDGIREKYVDATLPYVNIATFVRVFGLFQRPMMVGYAVWFN